MKKKVIAYLHTHWDREWYREFEVFRLRLLRVFDNVLNLLENNKIPSFYFDGQVIALLDYLEIRPEKEELVRKLIADKKLFIGPYYCLIDEFLTDKTCFEKNLEIGLKIARDFGCEDFIGYQADTFGHSKNVPVILNEFGIDKCMVWRGCPDIIPAEFTFNGMNTVNLVRGYFMDTFSNPISIEKKAELINSNLSKIAKKSSDVLLLPIGADHLGVEPDIVKQIEQVNALMEYYEIILSNPFEYFELVENNFKKFNWNDELRDNSITFTLQGCYSARKILKQYNTECMHKLELADKLQKKLGNHYENIIEYAYKLLLQNQAHDGICGCSTDLVHRENITRYEKILQISNTIIEELRLNNTGLFNFNPSRKINILEFESTEIKSETQIVLTKCGFDTELLHDTQRIPVTEDYTEIYTQLKEISTSEDKLFVSDKEISNSHIKLKIEDNQLNLYANGKKYENFIEIYKYKDLGDTYNYGVCKEDKGTKVEIHFAHVIKSGPLRVGLNIHTNFYDINIYLDKNSKLLQFKIYSVQKLTNKLWLMKFNLQKPVTSTFSEDMNTLIERNFDPNLDIRTCLPDKPGKEAPTNFAPMQRFVWTQGFGVITKGLNEYMVSNNQLGITLLRSIGIISNPNNPSRTTPAGPPIPVFDAQHQGHNKTEFAIGFFDKKEYQDHIDEIYPMVVEL